MRISVFFLLLCLISCSPSSYIRKELSASERQFHDHIGFMLYDLQSKKTLSDYQASNYFTPASNTKILTLYTSLQLLGDSVPSLKYIVKNDSLFFWGLGDPSFLYKAVDDNRRVYNFLSNVKQKIFFSPSNFQMNSLGKGWSWDDYNYYYAAERSPFPIYGNLVNILKKPNNVVITQPLLFMNHFTIADSSVINSGPIRGIDSNDLVFYPSKSKESAWEVPFHYESDLLVELLSDTLKKQVYEVDTPLPKSATLLKSVRTDSLYSKMMKESDNFIAEHLLMLCSSAISDTVDISKAIDFAKKKLLSDLPDEVKWVDGSGLSRFNLSTPRSIVKLWEKIYEKVGRERLFKLLATGGQPGTLANYYKEEKPFVFGKTGSLSNVSCLSGFLVTKTGKVLIFSFMNNNFISPAKEVREKMQQVLTTLHNKY